MAIRLQRAIFIHVPKTGGTWVAEALRRAHLVEASIGPVHATPQEIRADPAYAERPIHFAIVRHPVSWYASLWAHRMDENWCEINATDWFSAASIDRWGVLTRRCKSATFDDFVQRCVNVFPGGWLSSLYDTYITADTRVGRFETLIDDTITLLEEAGEVFDERIIRRTEPQNVRGSLSSRRVRGEFTRSILDMIHATEHRSYVRFGYGIYPPPIQLLPPIRRRSLITRFLARMSAR
jgi:hypothetical protein